MKVGGRRCAYKQDTGSIFREFRRSLYTGSRLFSEKGATRFFGARVGSYPVSWSVAGLLPEGRGRRPVSNPGAPFTENRRLRGAPFRVGCHLEMSLERVLKNAPEKHLGSFSNAKSHQFWSIWPNCEFYSLPRKTERIKQREMRLSRIFRENQMSSINDKRLGLINGQVLTVERISSDGAINTREGQTIPAHFRQWCHGYVVTSHKAQGRTADHVVVAAENLTAKGAYVACSRGRQSCSIHTPDKLRLMDRLPEGNRRAVLDVRKSIAGQPASIQIRPVIWATLKSRKSVGKLPSQSLIRKGVRLAQVNAQRVVETNAEDHQQSVRMGTCLV